MVWPAIIMNERHTNNGPRNAAWMTPNYVRIVCQVAPPPPSYPIIICEFAIRVQLFAQVSSVQLNLHMGPGLLDARSAFKHMCVGSWVPHALGVPYSEACLQARICSSKPRYFRLHPIGRHCDSAFSECSVDCPLLIGPAADSGKARWKGSVIRPQRALDGLIIWDYSFQSNAHGSPARWREA